MSTYIPDPDRIEDRIKCLRYDPQCDCPVCEDDRRQMREETAYADEDANLWKPGRDWVL